MKRTTKIFIALLCVLDALGVSDLYAASSVCTTQRNGKHLVVIGKMNRRTGVKVSPSSVPAVPIGYRVQISNNVEVLKCVSGDQQHSEKDFSKCPANANLSGCKTAYMYGMKVHICAGAIKLADNIYEFSSDSSKMCRSCAENETLKGGKCVVTQCNYEGKYYNPGALITEGKCSDFAYRHDYIENVKDAKVRDRLYSLSSKCQVTCHTAIQTGAAVVVATIKECPAGKNGQPYNSANKYKPALPGYKDCVKGAVQTSSNKSSNQQNAQQECEKKGDRYYWDPKTKKCKDVADVELDDDLLNTPEVTKPEAECNYKKTGTVWDAESEQCVCRDPSQILKGDKCVSVGDIELDDDLLNTPEITKPETECRKKTGTVWDAESEQCVCRNSNQVLKGDKCVDNTGNNASISGNTTQSQQKKDSRQQKRDERKEQTEQWHKDKCAKGAAHWDGKKCVCNHEGEEWVDSKSKCLIKDYCKESDKNAYLDNQKNKCVCKDSKKKWSEEEKKCVVDEAKAGSKQQPTATAKKENEKCAIPNALTTRRDGDVCKVVSCKPGYQKGNNDTACFEKEKTDRTITVSGKVVDKETNVGIPNIRVLASDKNNDRIDGLVTYTDSDGNFTLQNVPRNGSLYINQANHEYEDKIADVKKNLNIQLSKVNTASSSTGRVRKDQQKEENKNARQQKKADKKTEKELEKAQKECKKKGKGYYWDKNETKCAYVGDIDLQPLDEVAESDDSAILAHIENIKNECAKKGNNYFFDKKTNRCKHVGDIDLQPLDDDSSLDDNDSDDEDEATDDKDNNPDSKKSSTKKDSDEEDADDNYDEDTNDDAEEEPVYEVDPEKLEEKRLAYEDARATEQSKENRLLTAATTAATGIGGMELAQGLAEQNADKNAEKSMDAYIATMRCKYANGKQVKASTEEIELPGGNDETLMKYRNEYFTLAADLKERKEALGMKPGIESEEILDRSQMGLYDDENIGITDGAYSSLYRAKMLNSEKDQKQIEEEKEKSSNRVTGGATALGAGIVGGILGDQMINGSLGGLLNGSNEIVSILDKNQTADTLTDSEIQSLFEDGTDQYFE